ncbi:UNVERIFIED_CONTAM: Retrovirus-related Pol polyprotein from transposon RE2 [Sesamum radiatum]|uniref:Retrovirus-related Pol polyprotein from transposon RE2 n=1 Tax=Sesamum radiatum TaxID=300843 RepID=A0AAW2U7A2_SESRA
MPKCKCGGCCCGINQAIDNHISAAQVMQFLMGLHDSFNNERSQILMLDPLPDIEKAFSMVYAVEKQRAVHNELEANSGHMAYQMTVSDDRKTGDKSVQWKKPFVDKRNLVCTHCHKKGHARETCFQVHGVPDWYKTLGDKRKKGKPFAANFEIREEGSAKTSSQNITEIVAEVLKVMQKNTVATDPLTSYANYAQFDEEFAGNTVIPTGINENCWIIDTEATNHVCSNIDLFQTHAKLSSPHYIHLPDGSKRLVQYTGIVNLNNEITLENVLFVPQFSVNLLSVSQLCHQGNYQILFTQHGCVLQDQETKGTLVNGILHKKLYVYKQHYTLPDGSSNVLCPDTSYSASIRCSSTVWHNRLGHASVQALKHVVEVNCNDVSTDIPCDICHKAKQSRDVHFYENVFPFSGEEADIPSIPLPTVPLQSDYMLVPITQPTVQTEHGSLSSLEEPRSYSEAVKHVEWRTAMQAELDALEQNCTWKLVPLPAARGWPLQQLDVNNAFLHGHLEEDLYMSPPEGYSVDPGLVCKLERSIYGTSVGLMALLVYVDDILVIAPTLSLIQTVKDYLHSLFTIKDLGDARYFLGLEIARSTDGLYIAQTKYAQDIIQVTERYRRLVGRLLYLGFTRPDISHAVQQLSQYLTRPCDAHWQAAIHVVCYLKGAPSMGLFFPSVSSFELHAYCDADWASCTDSRRSLTGFCIFFGAALVS